MTKYLITVDHHLGVARTPMEDWAPAEVRAFRDYHAALGRALTESGELIGGAALTGPELARTVTSDGVAPVVTDGPSGLAAGMLAGYQLVDVDSEARAVEIAALVSQAPGPGGVPLQRPVGVRRVMGQAGADVL